MGNHYPTDEGEKESTNRRMFMKGVAGALGVTALGTEVAAKAEATTNPGEEGLPPGDHELVEGNNDGSDKTGSGSIEETDNVSATEESDFTGGSGGGNAPQIDQYDVTEFGARSPHADIQVDWEVSDTDGDLSIVLLQVVDDGNRTVDATRENLGGKTASDVNYLRIDDVDNQSFEVRFTVRDEQGNVVSTSTEVTE